MARPAVDEAEIEALITNGEIRAPLPEPGRRKESAPLTLIVIYVSDLSASTRFYTAVGLELQEEKHGTGPTHCSTTLPGGTVLELYPQGNRPASRNRLGFGIADLDAAVEAVQMIAPGALLSGPELREYGTVAVVEDPDGNRVELLSAAAGEGSDQ